MQGPLTTRGVLLQALREGPGYGVELIRRALRMTQGRMRLSENRVYPTLSALEAEGLVRASRVAPKGRRGARSRTYYDLTLQGVELSSGERTAIQGLVTRPPEPLKKRERAAMELRLLELEDVAEFGEDLRAAMRSRAQNPGARYVSLPPMTVMSTRVFRIRSGGGARTSSERTTKSASLPGASVPLRSSSKLA